MHRSITPWARSGEDRNNSRLALSRTHLGRKVIFILIGGCSRLSIIVWDTGCADWDKASDILPPNTSMFTPTILYLPVDTDGGIGVMTA